MTKRYQTTTFHGDRRNSATGLPSVIINDQHGSFDGIECLGEPRSTWSAESKSRSESCLSDGYFSGATGAMSVNTAYSDLDVN